MKIVVQTIIKNNIDEEQNMIDDLYENNLIHETQIYAEYGTYGVYSK